MRILYAAVFLAALPFLIWNGFVQQVNTALGDTLLAARSPARGGAVERITLLAIDDATVARYGPWPLKRSVLRDGLERLAELNPRVLAVDLLLSEPSPDDAALASTLGRFPKVVISAALHSDPAGPPRWIEPAAGLRARALLGHVHASPEGGVVRSVLLAKEAAGRRLWALGLQAVRLAEDAAAPLEAADYVEVASRRIPAALSGERQMIVNYAGVEGTFARVPFAALMDSAAPAAALRDRIVVLGVTAQGTGDRLFTPVSSAGLGMSGIEIHANVMRTILDGAFLTHLAPAGEFAASLLIAGAAVAAVRFLRGARLVAALAIEALALPAVCWMALAGGSIWPLGSFFMALACAAAIAGAGEYALVARSLRAAEAKRQEYAFRVQSIAHEIRTPLTAIQGSSEMISGGLLPDEKRAEMAGLIFKESKRLSDIIRVFLDVERMASGSLKLETRAISLRRLADDILERARLYAARKKISIDADVPEMAIQADPDLLSFAIYNLLTNAVKYSPKHTAVRLAAGRDDAKIWITVADQGYGIPAAERHRIFERFYRVKRDQKGAEEGSGIGLALVREIVEQHGGRISVESEPGKGSRFTIELPQGQA